MRKPEERNSQVKGPRTLEENSHGKGPSTCLVNEVGRKQVKCRSQEDRLKKKKNVVGTIDSGRWRDAGARNKARWRRRKKNKKEEKRPNS